MRPHMALHVMRLHPRPFENVKSGTKTIEIRLNDEKRQQLKIQDQIEFISRANPEDKLLVHITSLSTFSTFKDLCYAFPSGQYGSDDPEEYKDMYKYYSLEDEAKYGALAITFARV